MIHAQGNRINLFGNAVPHRCGLCLLILLTAWPLMLQASLYDIKFRHLTPNDGLSHRSVYHIVQDKTGYLWFATESGLNRFDGYNITVYKQGNSGLSCSNISRLLVDSKGFLWAATWGGGVCRFNPETGIFTVLRSTPGSHNTISGNLVHTLYEDSKGIIWIGTNANGLDRYNPKDGSIKNYRHRARDGFSLSNNHVWTIHEDRDGTLWIGTDNGLNRFDGKREIFNRYPSGTDEPETLSGQQIRDIAEDEDGILWLATENGLNRLDRHTNSIKRYFYSPKPLTDATTKINCIFIEKPGTLWLGTTFNGLMVFNTASGESRPYKHSPHNPGSLGDNYVQTIFRDHSGTTWLGTRYNGLSNVNMKSGKLPYLVNDPEDSLYPVNNRITAICGDNRSGFWLGTSSAGLSHFNGNNGKFTHYRYRAGDISALRSNNLWALYLEPDGDNARLWIGTDGGGLNRMNIKTGTFFAYQNDPQNPNSIANNHIYTIHSAEKDALWLGTHKGLDKLDISTGHFTHFQHQPGIPGTLSNNLIHALYTDREGTLWVGTRDGGLNRLEKKTGRFSVFRPAEDSNASIANNRINTIIQDPNPQNLILWLGTHQGLNRFDVRSGTFTSFSEKDGLANDIIYGILPDKNGALWISTYNGLSKFDPQKSTFVNFDGSDGLLNDEFKQGAYYKDDMGQMYFGCEQGVQIIRPENLTTNPFKPTTVITEIKVVNESITPETLNSLNAGKSVLNLTERDYSFSFRFAALHFAAPENNLYAYRLDGYDREWNFSKGNKREAVYKRLEHGAYTFEVKSANNDGLWNEEIVSIAVVITPPYWKTWWFRLLLVLSGATLILGIHRIRTNNLRAQKFKLETEVTRRTAELKAKTNELERALENVKTLKGLLPICARCKNIRDDSGYWQKIETYIGKHSDADFSHSLCPDCAKILYPQMFDGGDEELEF